MLVLLSAPRGRVSAARLLAHRLHRAEARVVVHLPDVRIAAEPAPRDPVMDGAEAADGARWPERGARQ